MHEAAAVFKTLLGFKTDALKKQFDSLSRSAVGSMTDIIAVTDSVGGSTVIEETSSKYKKFQQAIDDFRASVTAGTPDVNAFRRAVDDIKNSNSDESVKKLAAQLLEMTAKASGAQLAIDGTAKALRGFSAEALAAAEQGDAFAKAMKKLDASVMPDLTPRQKIMQDYTDAMVKADGTESRLAAARLRDNKLGILSDNERKKAAEEQARDAESAAKRFQSALQSTAKNNAEVAAATPAIGRGAGSLATMYANKLEVAQ